jgi:hypothetical protein
MQWLALLLLPPPPFLLFSTCLFVSCLPVIVSHHPPTYLTTVCILVNKVHCGKYGVLYKDPFMVHMLLLWFSGWYGFYRFIRPNCLWFESLTFVTMHVEILPTIGPI